MDGIVRFFSRAADRELLINDETGEYEEPTDLSADFAGLRNETASEAAGFTMNGRVVTNYFTRAGREGELDPSVLNNPNLPRVTRPVARVDVPLIEGLEEPPRIFPQQPNAVNQALPETTTRSREERVLAEILARNYGMTLQSFHRMMQARNQRVSQPLPEPTPPTTNYDDLPPYESCNEYRDIFLQAIRESEQQASDDSQIQESSL